MATLANPVFNGADYRESRDWSRLTTQLQRVEGVMSDHQWRDVRSLCAILSTLYPDNIFPENSIQAQLRNLRKLGYVVSRDYVGSGIYQYKLEPRIEEQC